MWSSVLVRRDDFIRCDPCRHLEGSGGNRGSAMTIHVTPLIWWGYSQSRINTENMGFDKFEKYAKSSYIYIYTSNYRFQFKQIAMALLVFVVAVLVRVAVALIRVYPWFCLVGPESPFSSLSMSCWFRVAAVFVRVPIVFVRDNTVLALPWWSLPDRQCWKMSTYHPGSSNGTVRSFPRQPYSSMLIVDCSFGPFSRSFPWECTRWNVTCENKEL